MAESYSDYKTVDGNSVRLKCTYSVSVSGNVGTLTAYFSLQKYMTDFAYKPDAGATIYPVYNAAWSDSVERVSILSAYTQDNTSYPANTWCDAPTTNVYYYDSSMNMTFGRNYITKTFDLTREEQVFTFYASLSNRSYNASGSYHAGNLSSEPSTTAVSVVVPTAQNYVVSYDANGGSNAPGQQHKWIDEGLVLSTQRPTRPGYTFVHWSSSAGNFYPGDTYYGNAPLTLRAVWSPNSYDVIFYANSPTGVDPEPDSIFQSFVYDSAQNLTPCSFSFDEYAFTGWATTSTGAAVYTDGALVNNLTTRSGGMVNLYATWRLDHKQPTITNCSVKRCESDGTLSDDGSCVEVTFDWEVVAPNWSDGEVDIAYAVRGTQNWSDYQESVEGKSGTFTHVFTDEFASENTYDFMISFRDTFGAQVGVTDIVSQAYYTMDFKDGGHGIAFGTPAVQDGFECAMDARFTGGFALSSPLSIRSGGTGLSLPEGSRVPYIGSDNILDIGSRLDLKGKNSTDDYWVTLYVANEGRQVFLESKHRAIANSNSGMDGQDIGSHTDLFVGNKVELRSDSDGGNLTLISPAGAFAEMDLYNNCPRLYWFDTGGNYKTVFNANSDGSISLPYTYASAVNASHVYKGGRDCFGCSLLFYNGSGDSGTIYLNDYVYNYDHIDVMFRTNDYWCFTNRIYYPNGKTTSFVGSWSGITDGSSVIFFKSSNRYIQDNYMSVLGGSNANVNVGISRTKGAQGNTGESTQIWIIGVWGYV